MLLHYIRGQRGVDLDGKCKKKTWHEGYSLSPPPNTHTHRPTTILLDLFKKQKNFVINQKCTARFAKSNIVDIILKQFFIEIRERYYQSKSCC